MSIFLKLRLLGLTLFFNFLFVSSSQAANLKPTIISLSPSSGTSDPYQAVSFIAAYSDANGWQNIQSAYLMTAGYGFYGYYNQDQNRLYAYNPATRTWIGGFSPGSPNIIDTHYSKLDCSRTTISGAGNNLTINWSITFKTNYTGLKAVYLMARDDSNLSTGWMVKGSWKITSNIAPVIGSLTPANSTAVSNTTTFFNTVLYDGNGWQDIQLAYFMTTSNGFYAYYSQNLNKLYVYNPKTGAFIGGFAPGSSNIIDTYYSKLDCSQTTVTGAGNSLSITWAVTFKQNYAGKKLIYLMIKDNANTVQGWVNKGSVNIIANYPPVINAIIPENGSISLAKAKINIQVNATDQNKDILKYQFFIGEQLAQDWSTSNNYEWQTSNSDTGTVGITCNVKDTYDKTDTKTITIHIVEPTIDEILKRVVDNYAKISDLKADMILSSTLNGSPFGQNEYCRYYLRPPNQEKTETFSSSNRIAKTDTIITNGSDMYLINPIKKTTQKVDLLIETRISPEQFNQTDLYYNQGAFLNNHNVIENSANSDLSNSIVVLEATPKTPNNIYTKLGLYIDYNKGLLSKIVYYKDNEPPQTFEAVETLQMPNGAWVVSKLKKVPNLTAGDLIVTLTYSNIKINSGLIDAVFDPTKQY